MAGPATTGQHSAQLAPGLRKVYAEGIETTETEYTQIHQIPPMSKRAYEDDLQVALLGTTPTKPEGSATLLDAPLTGATVRYTMVSYGLGFRVTREMYSDGLYGVMQKAAKDLAGANMETIETQAASVLNLATSAASYAGFDGLALCHTAHTTLGAGVYANRPTTDVEMSQGAVQAAIDTFNRMINERGRRIRLRPWRLIHPPELLWVAREILGSPYKTGLASGPGNEINALKPEDLQPFMYRYLTSTKHWHLAARNHDVKVIWREKPSFGNWDERATKDMIFDSYFRMIQGFSSPRGWYGSFPA